MHLDMLWQRSLPAALVSSSPKLCWYIVVVLNQQHFSVRTIFCGNQCSRYSGDLLYCGPVFANLMDKLSRVLVATDNVAPGHALAQEFARGVGEIILRFVLVL